jgi:hypothetical protein
MPRRRPQWLLRALGFQQFTCRPTSLYLPIATAMQAIAET